MRLHLIRAREARKWERCDVARKAGATSEYYRCVEYGTNAGSERLFLALSTIFGVSAERLQRNYPTKLFKIDYGDETEIGIKFRIEHDPKKQWDKDFDSIMDNFEKYTFKSMPGQLTDCDDFQTLVQELIELREKVKKKK